mgnify:CR=1 FL=1
MRSETPARALRKGGACGGGPLPPEPLVPPAQVLSTLATADQRSSEAMYELLYDVLRRADMGINLGCACIYECVRTITTIYPVLNAFVGL